MYIHAVMTIVLERAWAALKCDQLPVVLYKKKIKKKTDLTRTCVHTKTLCMVSKTLCTVSKSHGLARLNIGTEKQHTS